MKETSLGDEALQGLEEAIRSESPGIEIVDFSGGAFSSKRTAYQFMCAVSRTVHSRCGRLWERSWKDLMIST